MNRSLEMPDFEGFCEMPGLRHAPLAGGRGGGVPLKSILSHAMPIGLMLKLKNDLATSPLCGEVHDAMLRCCGNDLGVQCTYFDFANGF